MKNLILIALMFVGISAPAQIMEDQWYDQEISDDFGDVVGIKKQYVANALMTNSATLREPSYVVFRKDEGGFLIILSPYKSSFETISKYDVYWAYAKTESGELIEERLFLRGNTSLKFERKSKIAEILKTSDEILKFVIKKGTTKYVFKIPGVFFTN